jgi:hypothetical protein
MIVDHATAVLGSNLSPELYYIGRGIGRLAFPIFCFLIAECYVYTQSFKRYALGLAIFAALTEVPFDMMVTNDLWNLGHQNVFFTLLLGLLALYVYDWWMDKRLITPAVLSVGGFMLLAFLLKTDYSWYGVLLIFICYVTRECTLPIRLLSVAAYVCIGTTLLYLPQHSGMGLYISYAAVLALIPIALYNDEPGYRSKLVKWLFYIIYPLHITILCLIRGGI